MTEHNGPWNDGSQEPCKGCGQFHPRGQKWSDPDVSRRDANLRAFHTICTWAKSYKQAMCQNGAEPIDSSLFYWPIDRDEIGAAQIGGEWLGEGPPTITLTVLEVLDAAAETLHAECGAVKSLGVVTEALVDTDDGENLSQVIHFGSVVRGVKEVPTNAVVACLAYHDEEGQVGFLAAVMPVVFDGAECVMDTLLIAEVMPGKLDEEEGDAPLTNAIIEALTKASV